jgi:hypothetical protein
MIMAATRVRTSVVARLASTGRRFRAALLSVRWIPAIHGSDVRTRSKRPVISYCESVFASVTVLGEQQ